MFQSRITELLMLEDEADGLAPKVDVTIMSLLGRHLNGEWYAFRQSEVL